MAEIKTWNITKTPTSEYVARRKRLYDKLAAAKADAVIVYSDKEMRYLSGSMCMQLERPMALVHARPAPGKGTHGRPRTDGR